MIAKLARRHLAWTLILALCVPSLAQAGPLFGDWEWPCWLSRDCPRGEYSPLHYWTPEVYKARAFLHPSNLDQYPPGPCPPVPITYEFNKYRCPSTPPAPTTPYANPAAFYGR